MQLSKRDLEIVAACTIALGSFDGEVTPACDVSHFSDDELDRGAHLMETLTVDDLDAALSQAEWLYQSAERAS